jgi:hypothetical protein
MALAPTDAFATLDFLPAPLFRFVRGSMPCPTPRRRSHGGLPLPTLDFLRLIVENVWSPLASHVRMPARVWREILQHRQHGTAERFDQSAHKIGLYLGAHAN